MEVIFFKPFNDAKESSKGIVTTVLISAAEVFSYFVKTTNFLQVLEKYFQTKNVSK